MHAGRAEKATSCLIIESVWEGLLTIYCEYRSYCSYMLEGIEEKGYLNQCKKNINFFCRHKRNIH